jgi:formylglycine-generating enzyme required for sulfatase activity
MRLCMTATAALVAMAATTSACGSSKSALHAPENEIPAKVSVAGGNVTTGVSIGVLRRDTVVHPFSISKEPITVREYKQCVAAGACSAPSITTGPCSEANGNSGTTYPLTKSTEDRPVTCVTSTDATAYCGWVGGRLPLASEWTLAARGPRVQRYAWGDSLPTCAQRPTAGLSWTQCCGVACDSDKAVAVGGHPAGDSAFGMSDVLLARGELVAADPASAYPACENPGLACIAMGFAPGSIDSFVPAPADLAYPTSPRSVPSFRCAWDGAAQ